MVNKVVPGRRSREPKIYTLTLRLSDLIWMGVGSALALSIFFLFGLLIGRGYVPAATEEAVPGQGMHAAAPPAPASEPPAPVVLKTEDLTYPDKLAQTEPAPAAEAAAKAEPAAAKAPEKSATPSAPASAAAKSASAPKSASVAKGASFETTPPEPGETPFHYVYQCAAFKDRDAAAQLAARLEARGLKVRVVDGAIKGQLWHRVQVLFTGTPSQTGPLRAAIEDVTGQKPLRAGKTPAN